MNGQQETLHLLRTITGKHYIQFLRRGNAAIKQALKLAKKKGKTRLLIPDQAGWITYPQLGKELGYDIQEIQTNDGYIEPSMIQGDEHTVLLINTMPAYAFTLPVAQIAQTCTEQHIFFINDASASIGTPQATFGDIIIGSCNRWKPLPLLKGGFLASNEEPEALEEPELDYERLQELLNTLPERCAAIYHEANTLKTNLQDYSILYPDHKGYNVIVTYETEEEKERLINKVKTIDDTIEYTECPRYIRVNKQALSFEIKRHFNRT